MEALKLIYRVCPKPYLMETLVTKDYQTSIEILTDELDEVNSIKGMFVIFDALEEALNSGSVLAVVNVIKMCEKEYPLVASIDIINILNSLSSEYITPEETEEATTELEVATNYLRNYFNVTHQEIYNFAQELLKMQKKKYPKEKALEKFYSLSFYGENVLEDITKITEDLIYGGEVTMYDVWESIIDCNPNRLLEQMGAMRLLREKYYEYKTPEVNNLQKRINSILNFGLKRKK